MPGGRGGILWKPQGENSGNLVIGFPYNPGNVVIRDADGNIVARGRNEASHVDGYHTFVRFDRPGSAFNNVTVEDDTNRSFSIEDGQQRYEEISYNDTGETTEVDPESGTSGELPDIPGGDLPPNPFLVDPSIITTPDPVSFPVIPIPNYNFTDPIENTRKVGEFNREQSEQNFIKAMERSRQLNAEELESIKEFAAGMSDFQLELLDTENAFNQQQRLKAAEVAIPGVQGLFARQRERAETLAGGRLLETSEDRALELAARSASAEGNVIRGFGDDSVVGRRTSDILTAQQRLGLQQVGEGFLAQSVSQAANILMDQPTKANIAARLPAQPAVPVTALVPQLQQLEDRLTTIDPATALASTVQQEQFVTGMEQRTNEFNATGIFDASKFNSEQMFAAILSRANIIAGNVNALNEAQRETFNVEESRRQFEEAQRLADQAIRRFRRNQDTNSFYQYLGALFGGLANVPNEVWDYIGEQIGIGRPDSTDTSGGGNRSPEGGGRRPNGEGQPPTGGENRPPQEDRDDGTGFEEDDEEETFEDDEGGSGEDFEGDTEDDIIEENEGDGIPKFAKNKRQREIAKAGIKKRRLRLTYRQIDGRMKFNSGATLFIDLKDDEDMVGVI